MRADFAWWESVLQNGPAPLTGLIGVLIGAFLTTRGQSKAWLKDQRLLAYRDFIIATNDVIDFFAATIRAAARMQRALPEASEWGEKLATFLAIYQVVHLVGGPAVVNRAGDMKNAIDEAAMLVAESATGSLPYSTTQWDAVIARLREVQAQFPFIARQDLGSRARRERTEVTTWTPAELRARLPEGPG